MELYIKLFEVLFPVFFIVGIGYFLGQKSPKIDKPSKHRSLLFYHPDTIENYFDISKHKCKGNKK